MFSTYYFYLFFLLTAPDQQNFSLVDTRQHPDSTALVANTWVLRERVPILEQRMPDLTQEAMLLALHPNHTFQLVKQPAAADGVSTIEVVEEGRWEIDTGRGIISMQTLNVDGRAILSTMMPRWHVKELTAQQMVLQPFISKAEGYLIFEPSK